MKTWFVRLDDSGYKEYDDYAQAFADFQWHVNQNFFKVIQIVEHQTTDRVVVEAHRKEQNETS